MIKLISLTLVLSFSALCTIEAKPMPGACVLTVPKDPLSAKGLATPYILKKGNCDQTITDQQVFVEATVFDPATRTFSVYQPLVINEGKLGRQMRVPDQRRNEISFPSMFVSTWKKIAAFDFS